jgi:hypothetical protein
MFWATFWAIFSRTHPVTLVMGLLGKVVRWFIFKPKIQIWVNFGGTRNGKGWYML